jgi:hypothetical protein
MARGETLELEAGTDQEGEAPEEHDDGAPGAEEERAVEHCRVGDRGRRSSAAAAGHAADDDGEVGGGSGI